MHHRVIALFAVVCLALGAGGCASKSNKDYEEVLMPLQTGSVFHRRTLVRTGPERKTRKKKDKEREKPKEKTRKPDAEPSATPASEQESTPPPDRFR